jgi:cell division protein FtsN
MVDEAPAKKRGKGVFILILLVVAGLSAVVGFIVFKDRFFGPRAGSSAGPAAVTPNRAPAAQDNKPPDPRNAQTSSSVAQNAKPAGAPSAQSPEMTKPSASSGAPSGDSGKPTTQASQPPQTNPPVTATPAQASGGAGQAPGAKTISLQAASFPSEASAKQYQDKLVKAGLPAYVVAADIPHRGRWYRVRAGKFGNQEEAHQAAESFRKQAAAAGINLQLVPCDYQ